MSINTSTRAPLALIRHVICKVTCNFQARHTMMKLVSLLWFKPNSCASAWNRKRVETALLFYFTFRNQPLPPSQIHNVPIKNQLPPQQSPGSDSSCLRLQKQVCESKTRDPLTRSCCRRSRGNRSSSNTAEVLVPLWGCSAAGVYYTGPKLPQSNINQWINTTIKAPNALINL